MKSEKDYSGGTSEEGYAESVSELLPCPFCGSNKTAKVQSYFDCDYVDQDNGIDGFVVICDASGWHSGCGAATGWAASSKAAAELWNKRSALGVSEKQGDAK